MYPALLECFYEAQCRSLYPHPLAARRYASFPPHRLLLRPPTGVPCIPDLTCVVMLTLLLPRDADAFRISHQEMIKGIRLGGHGKTLRFFDTLEVPIIENTADEEDLTSGMAEAMEKFPNAAAILVRRHGVYVWGTSSPPTMLPPMK